MEQEKNWLVTLLIQTKIHSIPYVTKFLFFVSVVIIMNVFSDSFISKFLSALTYTSGICIDAYFLNKQCKTDSKKVEAFIFLHMIIMWAGTISIVLILFFTFKPSFEESKFALWCQYGLNLFILYSTITPLLEAVINCNGNQLSNNIEVKS